MKEKPTSERLKIFRSIKQFFVGLDNHFKKDGKSPVYRFFLWLFFIYTVFYTFPVALMSYQPDKNQMEAAKYQNITADEFIRSSCQLKSACTDWAEARQRCATAGSFNNCMSIKLSDAENRLLNQGGGGESACNTNGSIKLSDELIPSGYQCLYSKFIN